MKNKINSIFALGILVVVSMACSFSFSTAKLDNLKFGKEKTATPASTTFNPTDEIFVVTAVKNAVSKNKVKFRLLFDNVQGAAAGTVAYKIEKEVESPGADDVWFNFSVPSGMMPGIYKAEVVMTGEDGKELDRKTSSFTIKGDAPASAAKPPAAPTDSTHADDSKDKDDDN